MSWNPELAKKYFQDKKVLITMQNLAAARAFKKTIKSYQFNGDLIEAAADVAESKKLLETFQPDIVFCDIAIGKEQLNDLLKTHLNQSPNRLRASTILVSGDPNDLSLGTFAELGIDGILFKPYTLKSLQEVLDSSFTPKFSPLPYAVQLEQAKMDLKAGKLSEAQVAFENSLKLNPKHAPTYAGYAELFLKLVEYEKSAAAIESGLSIDAESFLCLNVKFDLAMTQKQYDIAYATAAEMHRKHPPSTSRMLDLVKLSIYCSKYDDIVAYCNHFKTSDGSDDSLNRVVIAALLISSKYFRNSKQEPLAKEILKDATRISAKAKILEGEVFRYLIENNDLDEADGFFMQLSEGLKQRSDIQIARMELLNQFQDYANLIQLGQKLIQEKLDSRRVYDLMIEVSAKLGRSQKVIDDLISEADMRHPQK